MASAAGPQEDRRCRCSVLVFTGAQDYDDGWPSHVAVTGGGVTGATATTTVTIGANGPNRVRRLVTLHRETGRWKIASVTAAR